MKTITITSVPGFEEWREKARTLLLKGDKPEDVTWDVGKSYQDNLFEEHKATPRTLANQQIKIPKVFLQEAAIVACHKDEDRFNLLYRILWRLTHENKNLLKIVTDKDVIRFYALLKAVRRDAYKITAFLRFREVFYAEEEVFIAWYEPEHYSLELKLDFFKTRFKNMKWSILTPYRAAHWNGHKIKLDDNPDPSLYPKEDQVERYWIKYYASIFNPARAKKKAMLSQMPKKYWKNMPETRQIGELLKSSERKTKEMIESQ